MGDIIENVDVALDDRSYSIVIGNGLMQKLGELLETVTTSRRCFILTDENIRPHYLELIENALSRHDYDVTSLVLPAGEGQKSFTTLENILNDILACKPDRNSLLIALGGGVIGDLTGFAASILLRGVPFIQIPTTLLSQVDSSVGGKTGINTKYGKNLIGSFYQPKLVVADLQVFATLPKRDFLSGYAEVVKYALINQPKFFAWLEKNEQDILEQKEKAIAHCVKVSCQAKAAIVAEDERESGKRALLNLGHTFGHAYEALTGYGDTLFHGEAVALGMIAAFEFSCHLGLCDKGDLARIKKHFIAMGLPTSPQKLGLKLSPDDMLEAMYHDKKVKGRQLVFILQEQLESRLFLKK